MAKILFTIPDAKLARVKAGLLELYPNNETIDDPAWTVPTEQAPLAPQLARYTDNEWLKERVRRFVVDSVQRGESKVATIAAKDALIETDTLIS